MRTVALLILTLVIGLGCRATDMPVAFQITSVRVGVALETDSLLKERLIAAGLTVALGPFGVHRMYLGTDLKVPLFYTLTLGGGLGILPLIDLCCIAFTRDFDRLRNHPGIFLFGEKQSGVLRSRKTPHRIINGNR